MVKRILAGLLVFILATSAARAAPVEPASVPAHAITTAGTNATSLDVLPGAVYIVAAINPTTTLAYLKFIDKASSPTCGTDAVVFTVPIPYGASNAGGGVVIPIPNGIGFKHGIAFCVTGALADADTSNAAAGISISLGYR